MISRVDHATDFEKPTLRLEIPPAARHASTVRDALIGFAQLHGVAQADLDSLLFAVGEALANAVEHAASTADITVHCSIDDGEIIAQVVDAGRGIAVIPQGTVPLPAAMSERGRGIPIMQRCTDSFSIESAPGRGTVITLRLRRRFATH